MTDSYKNIKWYFLTLFEQFLFKDISIIYLRFMMTIYYNINLQHRDSLLSIILCYSELQLFWSRSDLSTKLAKSESKPASRDQSMRIQSSVTRLGGGALKLPIQLTHHQPVSGRYAAREEGEKVRMWPRDGILTYICTYIETWRRTSSSSSAVSVGLSSANGITLTQWHSDYIIAGFSRAVRSRSLRAGESARVHYCTSVFVASSRSFPRILLRRSSSLLSFSLSLSLLSFGASEHARVPPRLVDYPRETNDAAAKE